MTNKLPDAITDYLALAETRPECFTPSEDIPILLDGEQIYQFSISYNRPMGIVYNNLPYYLVVADLCQGPRGLYSYARVVYPNSSNGAVAIPIMDGKYGLLRNFRHAPRMECLEFPRGFADKTLPPEELIRQELTDELGASTAQVRHLGRIQADTGLSSGFVDIFLAELTQAQAQIGHEGIRDVLWLTEEELRAKIRAGIITDGFTLSAFALLQSQ